MGKFLTDLLPTGSLNEISILMIHTVISTLVILITAEFLPKAIFRIYANETLWFFAPITYFFYIIFHYISNFITAISDFFLKLLFNSSLDIQKTEFSKEELGNYISTQLEHSKDEDDVDSEIQKFQNAMGFDNF